MRGTEKVKGVVLAGSYEWGETTFENLMPRPLVPVAQAPLISYLLEWLRGGGVLDATICANSAGRAVREHFGDGRHLGMTLAYYEDWSPRGPAGCARDASLQSTAETYVISDGSIIPTVNLEGLLETHAVCQAALTVLVHHEPGAERSNVAPGGIYIFDRRVFDSIPATGFQDIKETLIPRLYHAGERIVTHTAYGNCPRVLNARTYLAVNHWMVERLARRPRPLQDHEARGEALVHHSARVADSARLVGPVLVGPEVTIRAGATVVGPATIGAFSTIEEGALVSRSVAWNRCGVRAGAVVDRCLLADEAVVEPNASVFSTLRAPERRINQSLRDLATQQGHDASRPAVPGTGTARLAERLGSA
jgi:NDP-sugar pyrophosphorylase family protein